MLGLANFKVNLGLYITEKRPDGFHNLETIFIPVLNRTDEIVLMPNFGRVKFEMTGADFVVDAEKNLCVKAFRLLQRDFNLPNVDIQLVKNIPSGAGLGGGSSDAAMVLKMTNEFFELKLTAEQLKVYAAQLGSDVPFFIENRPIYATGRGEILSNVEVDLSAWKISVFKPDFSISTAEAYAKIKPIAGRPHLCDLLAEPVERWKEFFPNDFEKALFPSYPILAQIKQKFYDLGAVYAALSGSGSAVFALAKQPINLSLFFNGKDI